MPTGNRIRSNNSFGLITDAPLTSGATTFNSTQLSTLPVVSSAHAVVVLDPKRVNGEPEIVIVTSHTASATVATITRAQYGTVARAHPVGTAWAHVPVDEDYIEILTSGTRPTNPYEGQFIFETNTNKLVGYGGTDWAPRDAGGQLGYAQVVANQGAIVTEADLTGLTVTVTVGTGRRIKITGFVDFINDTVNGGSALYVQEDGVQIARWLVIDTPVANNAGGACVIAVRSPSAGSHTYKLRGARQNTGTVTLEASAVLPAFILVEDIGAA